jgi:hypothetical protein
MINTMKLLLFAAIFFIKPAANETLNNTKWTGSFNVPAPAGGELEFRNDSVWLSVGGDVIETMSYKEKGDTLLLQKFYGPSPCSSEIGTYKYQLKEGMLLLSPIADECEIRANAFSPDGYKKSVN